MHASLTCLLHYFPVTELKLPLLKNAEGTQKCKKKFLKHLAICLQSWTHISHLLSHYKNTVVKWLWICLQESLEGRERDYLQNYPKTSPVLQHNVLP